MDNCSFCGSNQVVSSRAYSDMWFCKNCGQGDFIKKETELLSVEYFSTSIQGIIEQHRDKKMLFFSDHASCLLFVDHYRGINLNSLHFYSGTKLYQDVKDKKQGLYCMPFEKTQIIGVPEYSNLEFDVIILGDTSENGKDKYVLEFLKYAKLKKPTKVYIFK